MKSSLKIGIVIQARVGSSRLPNKMLMPFYKDQSILDILIERFKNEIKSDIPFVIATTISKADDKIETLCKREHVNCFRGSENDVLLRFIEASEKFDLDYIFRVCADNPLFDISGTVDLVHSLDSTKVDYIGYKVFDDRPSILSHLGFWGELVSVDALKRVHSITTESFYREHVTNYIYGNSEQFKVELIETPTKIEIGENIRLTVDTMADFDMLKDIYVNLIQQNISISPDSIISFLGNNPDYKEMMREQIELNTK